MHRTKNSTELHQQRLFLREEAHRKKETTVSNASFNIEEDDIVRMTPDLVRGDESAGWVNVGAHAVRLTVNPSGDLTVETYPIGNEFDASRTGVLQVSHADALRAGAESAT